MTRETHEYFDHDDAMKAWSDAIDMNFEAPLLTYDGEKWCIHPDGHPAEVMLREYAGLVHEFWAAQRIEKLAQEAQTTYPTASGERTLAKARQVVSGAAVGACDWIDTLLSLYAEGS